MRSFLKIIGLQIQISLYYAQSFLLSQISNIILLIAQICLWTSIYKFNDAQEVGGYTLNMMYSYIILSFFMNKMMSWRNENLLSRKIISGSIVYDQVKPISFLMLSLGNMTGGMFVEGMLLVPIVVLIFLVFPGSVVFASQNMGLFFLTFLLGLILKMLIIHNFSLLCFFTTSHLGLTWTRDAIIDLFSGAVLPLALFPEALKNIAYILPFNLIIQSPLSIYLNQETVLPAQFVPILQIIWILIFILIQHIVWKQIQKRIDISGG